MKNAVALKGGAGYYSGTAADGRKVEVEYTTTAYGDKGWFGWIGGENVTDYPRQTKREVVALILRQLAN